MTPEIPNIDTNDVAPSIPTNRVPLATNPDSVGVTPEGEQPRA